jgi:hypothetical protein
MHKVKPSRNRASGLLVMPALMRLQQNNNNNQLIHENKRGTKQGI